MRKIWFGLLISMFLVGGGLTAAKALAYGFDHELEGVADGAPVVNIFQITPTLDAEENPVGLYSDKVPCWGPNPWSPDGEWVVYQTNVVSGGSNELAIVRPDGTDYLQLTDNEACDSHGSFTPDGTKIVFQRKNEVTSDAEIWIMNANGTDPVNLTAAHGGSSETTGDCEAKPVVSPDGEKILFHGNDVGLWVMNIDGSEPLMISGDLLKTSKFSWSPDSRWVLFNAKTEYDLGSYSRIYKVRPDGTDMVILSEDVNEDFCENWAAWSPDGEWISYHRRDGNWSDNNRESSIWIMRPDGSDKTFLVGGPQPESEEPDSDPYAEWVCGPTSWHPGSKWLAIKQYYHSSSSIIDIETQEIVQLTDGYREGRMWWSPDGLKILFRDRYSSEDRDGGQYENDLLVINLDDEFHYTPPKKKKGGSGCVHNPTAGFTMDAALLLALAGLLVARRRLNRA
jgi:Tol biopolymer transport system component